MQKRLQVRSLVEIASFPPEREVRGESGARRRVKTEPRVVRREQREPAQDERRGEDQRERRENAAYPARIELAQVAQAKRPALRAPENPRNQVPGDDEEHVDTDEAA